MDKLFEIVHTGLLWLSSPANRLRLRGARIEVVAFLLTRNPQESILLGKSPYHGMWMPPQEGVNLKESFEDALRRCLQVECGLQLPDDPLEYERTFHHRSTRFAGVVELARERWGERDVVKEAPGTPLEKVQLRRKAYWMASVLIGNASDIDPLPDGKELVELRWFPLEEARSVIRSTNHAEKAALLLNCLDACEKDLRGATGHIRESIPDARTPWLPSQG